MNEETLFAAALDKPSGSERQALALMSHPHIAKVLDAGVESSG